MKFDKSDKMSEANRKHNARQHDTPSDAVQMITLPRTPKRWKELERLIEGYEVMCEYRVDGVCKAVVMCKKRGQ